VVATNNPERKIRAGDTGSPCLEHSFSSIPRLGHALYDHRHIVEVLAEELPDH
jgi:hypothetical protein